jgi:hypothetical protein
MVCRPGTCAPLNDEKINTAHGFFRMDKRVQNKFNMPPGAQDEQTSG